MKQGGVLRVTADEHVNTLAEPFQEFARPRETGRTTRPLINLVQWHRGESKAK